MMRSMFSGVSGLKVHQTKMDVIGNNISNVNTVGYKAQRVTFNDVFSQTLQGASSANDDTGRGGINGMQVGLGVNISSIDMLMTQGAAERTDNPFDLMINGEGFIAVGDESGQYFTRNGALRVDDEGNLCIPNGMKVKGWLSQKNEETKKYEIIKGEVENLSLSAAMTSDPKETTAAKIVGNLDARQEKTEASIGFYDSLGNYYKALVALTGAKATDGTTTYTPTVVKVTDAKGEALKGYTYTITGTLKYGQNGELSDEANNEMLELTFTEADGTNKPDFTLSKVSINCKDTTRYASKDTVTGKSIDGNAAGMMSGYSIGTDGIITASYTNGDTRMIGQVIVAQFENPIGLEKAGDNLYRMTTNSGEFDGVGATGEFSVGCLEMSNVDLSQEFTQMIITQRGFQANSRIITVSDEMLQELTNLKR